MKKCPTCDGAVVAKPSEGEFPFCSKRCRAADLGSWLSADHKIVDPPMFGDAQDLSGQDLRGQSFGDLDLGDLDPAALQRLVELEGEIH